MAAMTITFFIIIFLCIKCTAKQAPFKTALPYQTSADFGNMTVGMGYPCGKTASFTFI
jgi:hypothetical protein